MMKLTVLGKYGPYPKSGGGTSSYLLQCGERNILIDAGSGCLSRLQYYIHIDDIDMMMLSHLHFDHCAEAFILAYALKEKLDVYIPKTPMAGFAMLENSGKYNPRIIDDFLTVKKDDIVFSFCRMDHPVETYAMRFEYEGKVFVYSGDSVYTEKLIGFAKDADTLLIDSGFMGEKKEDGNLPHMFVGEAGEIAKQAGVKRLLLTHINPAYDESRLLFEAEAAFKNSIVVQEKAQYEI